jgi:predicted secreted hydrolase
VRRGRALAFPRDHGAHLAQRIEWWYATGWLLPESTDADAWAAAHDAGRIGFQVTFFRSRTSLAEALPGRLAPRHLLFAHAAITTLTEPGHGRHRHAQRLARWSGETGSASRQRAALSDTDVALGPWWLKREPGPHAGRWRAAVDGLDGAPGRQRLVIEMTATQPVLLQGEAGFSRKGPQEAQASHYYSVPQLEAVARWEGVSAPGPLRGRAWLDHEWSDELLHPQAVGWDWIGMNLADGSALTAFVLRRADGTALWAGGSLRRAGGPVQAFGPQEVRWSPGRRWRSPTSGATYPVEWTVDCPAGRFTVQALADAQELDSRASTGTVYWEGLSALLDARGQRVGLGYLEMTGYAGRLVI